MVLLRILPRVVAGAGEDAGYLGRKMALRLLETELVDEGEDVMSGDEGARDGMAIMASVW